MGLFDPSAAATPRAGPTSQRGSAIPNRRSKQARRHRQRSSFPPPCFHPRRRCRPRGGDGLLPAREPVPRLHRAAGSRVLHGGACLSHHRRLLLRRRHILLGSDAPRRGRRGGRCCNHTRRVSHTRKELSLGPCHFLSQGLSSVYGVRKCAIYDVLGLYGLIGTSSFHFISEFKLLLPYRSHWGLLRTWLSVTQPMPVRS